MSKKIAILLPPAHDLGLLRRARQFSVVLNDVSDPDGSHWSTVVGVPRVTESQWRAVEKRLRSDNQRTTVRQLHWETVPVENVQRMYPAIAESFDLTNIRHVMVPRDWGWNFQDCEAAIMFGDAGLGGVFPLIPTLFYCTDLAVRIAPDNWAQSVHDNYWRLQTDSFRMWRQAAVATSDPGTADDLLSYAGVRKARIWNVPNVLALAPDRHSDRSALDRSSVAWLFGPGSLYDLENAAKALQIYFAEGGELRPIIVHDAVRDPNAGELAVCARLRPDLADVIYGLPSRLVENDDDLFRLLNGCAALWSSRIAGGEGEAPLLARQAGIPFLGADFAINRSTVEQQGVRSILYPQSDPLEIANSLHALEEMLVSGQPAKPRKAPKRDDQAKDELEVLLRRLSGEIRAA